MKLTMFFLTQFLSVCDEHAPIETKTVALKNKNKPWITKSIRRSIRKKHKLYSRVLKSKFHKDCLDKYKKYRNVLTTLVRTAKQLYYNNEFERDMKNSKRTWKHINDLLNKKDSSKSGTKISKLIKETEGSNVEVTSSIDIANTLNDFFSSIGETLASKIRDTNDIYTDYLGPANEKTFFFLPVTSLEVNEVISTLDQSKASGYDDLSVRLFVNAKDYISEPLAHILNLSFSTGIFPDKLKVARVVPVFKKGNKAIPGNYRPISILPIISKVFEKLVNTRLLNFLKKRTTYYINISMDLDLVTVQNFRL